jgi:hypothetical protein
LGSWWCDGFNRERVLHLADFRNMKGWLIRWLVTVIGSTIRYRIDDPHGLLRSGKSERTIFVFWHNRIFLMPYLFRKFWHPLGRTKVAVLISRSKDGQKLADVLQHFELACVRGSSSRGGMAALREMKRLVSEGYDIGITPDGPRGPCYVMQPGPISLAQITGMPIIPVSYTVNWKFTLKSWDRFIIPLPFGRCDVRIGEPVRVSSDADESGMEQVRLQVQRTLIDMAGEPAPVETQSHREQR